MTPLVPAINARNDHLVNLFRRLISILVACCLLLLTTGCETARSAQDHTDVVREVRGLWVATVANIDWPSKKGQSVDTLRAEMTTILDRAKALNLNCIFLQVRPACDAIYPSTLEPWSEFLSGSQGTAPGDAYDPLAEWIAGAHARGIQLHAWFNPFRARHSSEKSPLASSHIAAARPQLVRTFDNGLWLDPGDPAARAHSLEVMLDVVRRYDIDGVHLDDYFYPYPKKGIEFDDAATYAASNASGSPSRDDWRRGNVDTFVRTLYAQTKAAKPYVAVSISPFGIWRPGHPKGVTGFDAYAGLYADSKRWLREGWVDILIPQIYWRLASTGQPHAALAEWWAAQNPLGRTVAIGLIPSRVGSAEPSQQSVIDTKSWPAGEIVNQIVRDRQIAGIHGFALFSAKPLLDNRQGLADLLAQGVLAEPAIMPEMPWCAAGPRPSAPSLRLEPNTASSHVAVSLDQTTTDLAAESARTLLVRAKYPGGWRTFIAPLTETLRVPLDAPSGPLQTLRSAVVDRSGRVGTWTNSTRSHWSTLPAAAPDAGSSSSPLPG